MFQVIVNGSLVSTWESKEYALYHAIEAINGETRPYEVRVYDAKTNSDLVSYDGPTIKGLTCNY